MNPGQEISFDITLAGGVSTIGDGFMIGWPISKPEDCPIHCIALNREGELIAAFYDDQTHRQCSNLSMAEEEAIIGIKKLILKW